MNVQKPEMTLKGKILTFIILPISLPFMVPGLLKHIFYGISLLTEEIGAWFGKIDVYIGNKSHKIFQQIRKM